MYALSAVACSVSPWKAWRDMQRTLRLLLPVIRGMMEATPAQTSALTVGLARGRPASPLWSSDAASGPRLDPSAAVLMRIITLQQAGFSASVPGSAYRPRACRAQLNTL